MGSSHGIFSRSEKGDACHEQIFSSINFV